MEDNFKPLKGVSPTNWRQTDKSSKSVLSNDSQQKKYSGHQSSRRRNVSFFDISRNGHYLLMVFIAVLNKVGGWVEGIAACLQGIFAHQNPQK